MSHFENSDVGLWNLWKERVLKLHDMAVAAYRNMVCVETISIQRCFGGKKAVDIRIQDGVK